LTSARALPLGKTGGVTACPTIVTERLILRPFREEDLGAFTATLTAEPVRRSLHLPNDFGRIEAWLQMAMWLGQWALRGTGHWALEERRTGSFVGRAGLHRPERPDWPGVEVGWTLHPEHWGKGYATEAGRAAIEYAFEAQPELAALYSVILPENARSQAVARRLGFTFQEDRVFAFFPDLPHGIWRLERATWEQRQSTRTHDTNEGGDPACWLHQLCPGCDAVLEGPTCWRCGWRSSEGQPPTTST
jgi:RimJ/RimL family protein N-acetyltransferase